VAARRRVPEIDLRPRAHLNRCASAHLDHLDDARAPPVPTVPVAVRTIMPPYPVTAGTRGRTHCGSLLDDAAREGYGDNTGQKQGSQRRHEERSLQAIPV
jgi:hypothetical protein